MNKNKEIAIHVLELIGGKENLINAFHCATRLRLDLKDKGLVSLEKIKQIKGVVGTQIVSGELQVIIGPAVDDVYVAFIDLAELESNDQIHACLDKDLQTKDYTFKAIFNKIMQAFSACMNPLVPVFVLLGMANVIAALLGPTFLHLVSEESDLYHNFYDIGQAIIYFLPILIAVTAAKRFQTNLYISLVMAFILLYPNLVTLMSEGTSYSVYGIPAASMSYGSTVIPMMLIVYSQHYIEKWINHWTPNAIKILLVPLLTVMILLPIALCVLGPLGNYIGEGIASGIIWLREVAGPLETMIIAAVVPFMTAFGIGRPIFFICLSTLVTTGSEFAYMPIAMVLNNWLIMAVAAGFILKSKSLEDKQLGMTCFAANFLGGVSEPTLFGILLPNKKTYLPVIVGGAASGLYLGLMNVGLYQFGASNFLNVMSFIGGSSSNFMHGCIASGIAFFVTFAMMMITYHDKTAE